MKILVLLTCYLLIAQASAEDLTSQFKDTYKQAQIIKPSDVTFLKDTEIVMIPGIVSEAFSEYDPRGVLDVSFIFENYMDAQRLNFERLGLSVTVLLASSTSVDETLAEIDDTLVKLKQQNRKALFITHSTGGLVLLDYFLAHKQMIPELKGILFMQSPFYGTPVAEVYFKNPYFARTILRPLMPLVHTSENLIVYLTMEKRQKMMGDRDAEIKEFLAQVPVITAAGLAAGYRSLMESTVNIISHGCVKVIYDRCDSRKYYLGPYDNSDGMVPFESSKLPGVDFVRLIGVDHGETVVSMPFKSVKRAHMTDALLKLLLRKMKKAGTDNSNFSSKPSPSLQIPSGPRLDFEDEL